MQNQRVIQSVRDQPLIEAQNGFLFRFDKSSADKTKWYWRCNYRGCRARAVSGVNSVDLIVTQPVHLDFASPNNINRRDRVSSAKDIAFRMPLAPAGQVLAAAKMQMSEDQLRSFPSNEAMRKAVSRVRMPLAAGLLDCPLSQVDWALAERYTKNRADEQFLFYDSRTQYPDEKIVFGFASKRTVAFLNKSDRIGMDGTFYCRPVGFAQLYTVHAFLNEHCIPVAYFLMQDQSKESYLHAFEELFSLNADYSPENVMADMELAPMNAIKTVFPNISVNYCLFHVSQAMFAKMKQNGLLPLYDNADIRTLLRCFPAMALSPPEEVENHYTILAQEISQLINNGQIPAHLVANLENYVVYIRDNYVKRINRFGRTTAPRYNIEDWNCHISVFEDLPRTNNSIEAWNRTFNERFNKAKMSLAQFIERVIMEEEYQYQSVVQHENDPTLPLRNRPNKKIADRNRRIKVLLENYTAKEPEDRNPLIFLKAAQRFLMKQDYTVSGQIEVNNDDDQD